MAGPKIVVTFSGFREVLREFRNRPEETLRAVEAAMFVEAEQTITDAKMLTPVDEGVLRSSGHVRLPVRTADGGVQVELGFGGPAGTGNVGGETNQPTSKNPTGDVGYAVIQHEDLTLSHVKPARGGGFVQVGQAKYLETPVNRRKSGFSDRLIKRIRRSMGVV